MRSLNAVQLWFQTVITHPDGVDAGVASDEAQRIIQMDRAALEQVVTRSEKLSAAERLGVYANAYYARLVECLGETFPTLKRTFGENPFGGFAFDYLQRYPSTSYTLEKLADRFPKFLSETRPDLNDDGNPPAEPNWPDFLIELAAYELLIAEVFDGPGVERSGTLTTDDLRGVAPKDWPNARLVTAPCLRLVRHRFPVNAWYSDVRRLGDDADMPELPGPAEEFVAVTRRDFVVRRIRLSETQFLLLDALQRGDTVGNAIAAAGAATDMPDEQLAGELMQWFADWTAAQMFVRIETA